MQDRSTGVEDARVSFHDKIMPLLDQAYSFARFLSRDADVAQDIVQDAFLRAHRGFDGYRGGDARAWLFQIVRNCYHAWLSERRRRSRLSGELRNQTECDAPAALEVASTEDDPETALLRKSESETVHRVLEAMPVRLREIMVLREIEDLSYSQIAEVTSLPVGTVMSRLSRARRRFAACWNERAGVHGAALNSIGRDSSTMVSG
jgi:RNA polymerase sigma factor (sigma-70 family)